MRKILSLMLLLATVITLSSEIIAFQSFEGLDDNWNYTADPDSFQTSSIYWGRYYVSNGHTADGNWYWRADAHPLIGELTFDAINIENWRNVTLSFNSDNSVDDGAVSYSVKFDDGDDWGDYVDISWMDWWEDEVTIDVPPGSDYVRIQFAVFAPDLTARWDYVRLEGTPVHKEPSVYNVNAAQRTDGSKIVDINYDIFSYAQENMHVSVLVSDDGGETFAIKPSDANLSGDYGFNVSSGSDKHIEWNVGDEGIDFDNNQFVVQIIVSPASVMNEIVNSYFYMGRDGVAEPVHLVHVEKYAIGINEITCRQVLNVFNWALAWGQISCTTNSVINTQGDQKVLLDLDDSESPFAWNGSELVFVGYSYTPEPECPCNEITWYGALAYCRFLSIIEGIPPAISFDDWSCDFSSEGYRLPTEAEWEFSARSATNEPDYTYSGSNTLGDVGWYRGNVDQGSGRRNYPVGQKDPNGIGTFDQTGNVWEWCWDWWSDSYYSESPVFWVIGPASGSYRILRGGSFTNEPTDCDLAIRNKYPPQNSQYSVGFRLCRTIPYSGD